MENEGQNVFANEIESLKNMFGELVTIPVIVAVLESCEGDLNIAAEGIMSIVTEGPASPDEEENATGGSYFVETEPEIPNNIPLPPDASKIAKIAELRPCPLHGRPERTRNDDLYSNFSNEYPSTSSSSQDVRVAPPPVSYASVSRNTGAVPKFRENVNVNFTDNQVDATRNMHNITDIHNITWEMSKIPKFTGNWNDQFRNILTYHNQGSRVMIIMRGVPGSGKSCLARHIIEMTVGGSYKNFASHIFSSDDFFIKCGKYSYDRSQLQAAHADNQKKVNQATKLGLSPIIVDNTHVHIWEMGPYAENAVKNGYYIEIVQPNTPWAKSAHQLAKKNIHNVPKDKIKKMLENYEEDITVDKVFTFFKLSYPKDKKPPVLRNIPPLPGHTDFSETARPNPPNSPKPPDSSGENNQNTTQETSVHTSTTQNSNNFKSNGNQHSNSDETDFENFTNNDIVLMNTNVDEEKSLDCLDADESKRFEKILEAQKKQEEIINIEIAWENGEGWDAELKNTEYNHETTDIPKPPRNLRQESGDDKLLESSAICDDWSQISMFLPRWRDDEKSISDNTKFAVKTATCGTNIEIGDIDNTTGLYKILECNPRDINDLVSFEEKVERVPLQRMLDKSTSTHEHSLTETQRCKNEEKHFIAFRKMFKTVSRPILRDIFDKCLGDVNWAVNIVLDSIGDNEIGIHNKKEVSDSEEETEDDCDCLAAYNIIPASSSPLSLPVSTEANQQNPDHLNPNLERKPKKEKKMPENEKALELKRQIENHVMISDNHYSQHYLSLRRGRRDNIVHNMFKPSTSNTTKNDDTVPKASTFDQSYNENVTENAITSVSLSHYDDPGSFKATYCTGQQQSGNIDWYTELNTLVTAKASDTFSEDSDRNSESENISVNIGMDFVNKLDELFGRQGIIYPENIKPVVSIPMSLLKEINALWAESIAFQMDNASIQTKEMIKEDEEFARQLGLKEREIAQGGKEGDVPDFKELMDMDLALSIYEKDVAEWRNSQPQDMAAKMTRDKLYNLFPELSQETLSELLMAHNQNFHSTVESLLMSTGQGHILESENGINRFVMQKEMEKKEKILEEERRALSETEWPLLPQPGYVVTLDMVHHYREEAERFLEARNINFQKAQYYIGRNQLDVASFYSDIASYNTRRLEQANSLAAASLIQYHAANKESDILDLHFLRVAEAKETLDMFLDSKIQKLRDARTRGQNINSARLFIITGRGIHSPGLPRIKPAVKRRLHERDMSFFERNPGLLGTKINVHHKMTHEIPRST